MMDAEERMYYEMVTGKEYQDPPSDAHDHVFWFVLMAVTAIVSVGLTVAVLLYRLAC